MELYPNSILHRPVDVFGKRRDIAFTLAVRQNLSLPFGHEFADIKVTIQLNAGRKRKPRMVIIQSCPICEKEACEAYWFVHEQADDGADGVLSVSYLNF